MAPHHEWEEDSWDVTRNLENLRGWIVIMVQGWSNLRGRSLPKFISSSCLEGDVPTMSHVLVTWITQPPSVSRVRWKLRAEIMKCYGNQGYPLCADTWNRKIDHGEWRALRCINVSYVFCSSIVESGMLLLIEFYHWDCSIFFFFFFFLHVTGYYFINRFYNRFLIYLSIYIDMEILNEELDRI